MKNEKQRNFSYFGFNYLVHMAEEKKSIVTSFKFMVPFVILVILIPIFVVYYIAGSIRPLPSVFCMGAIYIAILLIGIGVPFFLFRKKYGGEVARKFMLKVALLLIVLYVLSVIAGYVALMIQGRPPSLL